MVRESADRGMSPMLALDYYNKFEKVGDYLFNTLWRA